VTKKNTGQAFLGRHSMIREVDNGCLSGYGDTCTAKLDNSPISKSICRRSRRRAGQAPTTLGASTDACLRACPWRMQVMDGTSVRQPARIHLSHHAVFPLADRLPPIIPPAAEDRSVRAKTKTKHRFAFTILHRIIDACTRVDPAMQRGEPKRERQRHDRRRI
jgi:hypothetical protein